MDQTERLIPHTWGQEGVSDKIHGKNRFGGPWADFGPILEGKHVISRHSFQIAIKPPDQPPPMDQTERLIPHTWGQEGVSDKIHGKNRFGGPWADFGPILEGKHVISRHYMRIAVKPPHQPPPMDQTERLIPHTWGQECISDKIDGKNRFGGPMGGFRPDFGRKQRDFSTLLAKSDQPPTSAPTHGSHETIDQAYSGAGSIISRDSSPKPHFCRLGRFWTPSAAPFARATAHLQELAKILATARSLGFIECLSS